MKELKVENYLKRGQFRHEYRQFVPFSEIDMKASRENPARLTTAVDEVRVTKYGVEMIDKVQFPAIVLLDLPQTAGQNTQYKWIIGTGVHRSLGAIEAGLKGFDAYVVFEPDAYRRDVLFKQLNTLEGLGPTIPEQVRLVIDLHLKWGTALRQLAKEWDLKEQQLKFALGDHRAQQRGEDHGYDFKKHRIPQKTYMALNRIGSDVTYQSAVQVVAGHKDVITPTTVEEMVGEIVKTKSETDAAAVIQKYRVEAQRQEQAKQRVHGRIPEAPANKMLNDAKRFSRNLDKGMDKLFLAVLFERDPTGKRALDILAQVMDRAKDIKAEIERIAKLHEQTIQAAE
jgi:hypothetical protein